MSANVGGVAVGSALLGRVYSVTLQPPTGPTAQWGNETGTQSALRVTFSIDRSIFGGNKGRISLTNASPKTRKNLTIGQPLRLRAGYVGLVGVLFIGIITKNETTREGPDIITTVEMRDGEPFTHMSVLDRSYGPGIRLSTILSDVARAMNVYFGGIAVPIKRGAQVGIPKFAYSRGFVAHGPCGHTLDILCKPRGLEWSVQNGTLTIIPKKSYNGQKVEVVSPNTGGLGIPSQTGMTNIPASAGKLVTFDTLLNPRIVPGCLVQLGSKNVSLNALYKVRTAKYEGDSHGSNWGISVEASRYDSTISPYIP